MLGKYIVRPGGVVEPSHDLMAWAVWFESRSETPFESGGRRVARTDLPDGGFVSTVFLGMDHGFGGSPLLFETMILDRGDERQWRYGTIEEARTGHAHAVRVACGEVEDS